MNGMAHGYITSIMLLTIVLDESKNAVMWKLAQLEAYLLEVGTYVELDILWICFNGNVSPLVDDLRGI